MKGYIVTQPDGRKVFFRTKPKMLKYLGKWEWSNGNDNYVVLRKTLFNLPDAVLSQKYSDEPIKVEISISLL